jgi:flagellar operon protein
MKVGQANQFNRYQHPVNLIEIAQRGKTAPKDKAEPGSFKDMFSRELAQSRQITFSKHARQRLFSRDIELTDQTLHNIADAVDRAAAKGSRETLVLTDDAALVVSVTNRTVVTAFDRDNLREGIVTSIDSAVIL